MGAVAALEIISSGPLTSIQDLGRFGYGRYGVAPSGAVDTFALRIANLLAGNRDGDAAIEITLTGFKARILNDLGAAIAGGDLQPCRNKQPLQMWRTHALQKGDILSFRGTRSGCRAYLALSGKIQVPAVMESKSTNLSAAFGGFKGRALKAGDILIMENLEPEPVAAARTLPAPIIPTYSREWMLRVLWGPQEDHFTEVTRKRFLGASFKVTPQSNRFGIRLEGPKIISKAGMKESIISEGVIAGTIQVPGDGQPIIILGETVTGGYRKIATIIAADLPLLGQIKPGNRVVFQAVSLEAAQRALKDMEKIIQDLRRRFSRQK